MKNNYTYPAIFDYNEKDVINISFPDFPYGMTCVEEEKDLVKEAQDFLALTIADYESKGKETPVEGNFDIKIGANQSLVYINVWMPYHRTKVKEIYVKKTLTIPQWLDELARANNVNYSACLVEGLKKKLNL